MAEITPLNRALIRVPKRAESRHSEELRDTFVDTGAAAALEAIDHQILYGRRGTGKTHALNFVASSAADSNDLSIYVDLRVVGSPDGITRQSGLDAVESSGRLLRDLLHHIYDNIMEFVVESDRRLNNKVLLARLDDFLSAIGTVAVVGETESEESYEESKSRSRGASGGVTLKGSGLGSFLRGGRARVEQDTGGERVMRRGRERIAINFTDVAKALRELTGALERDRIWLLLDEWSSLPRDVQPYLGEFLVRCVLPLQGFTVKIAAIEQQSSFRGQLEDGTLIGIELGADVSATVDLDEFMVFERSADRARDFFLNLFYKHLTSGGDAGMELASASDLIRHGFTDRRAFDELVRAAEGVPRDAINVAGKAALKALDKPISVPAVRSASRSWYQSDKEGALRGREKAQDLLNWIIDEVIRGRRARAFLVNRRDTQDPLLLSLFDARVLHVVRKGYSAQDSPRERYDVYVIDYGAYVDLMRTTAAPQGMLPGLEDGEYVEVPSQDLRAIRRAVLDLHKFYELRSQRDPS